MLRYSSLREGPELKFAEPRRSVERFAAARGIRSIEVCTVNQRPDRRIYRLGGRFFAKAYAPEARDRYQRDRGFLELGERTGRCPELVEAAFDAQTGGYLVSSALRGRPLIDIHQDLTAQEYAQLVGDLGACLAAIHAVPLAKVLHLPPTGLEAQRRRQFDSFPDVIDRLKGARVLPTGAIPALVKAVSRGRDAAFASPMGFIHGDVHDANVFVSRRAGRWSCALIDFEESAPGHTELDFVYPFVSILGKAFPGRRLAASWEGIWRSFAAGYASLTGTQPDPQLTVGHALAWYLWVAADCLDRGHPKARQFAQVALEALAAPVPRRMR